MRSWGHRTALLSVLGCVACTATLPGTTDDAGGRAAQPVAAPPGDAVFRLSPRVARLSHTQWVGSVRDLLGVPHAEVAALASGFVRDPLSGTLDNAANELVVDDGLRADYQRAAEALAARVAGDVESLRRLAPATGDFDSRARSLVTGLVARAYRRPLTDAEIVRHLELFRQGPALSALADPFAAGVETLLRGVLQSPYFLYRTELTVGSGTGRLDPHEIAAKVALALTNSLPDSQLAALADDGSIVDPAVLVGQVRRLLATPGGGDTTNWLHHQLLGLRGYDAMDKDPALYPEFGPRVPWAMKNEILLFLRDLVDRGGGVRDVLSSTETFVNRDLAPLYGLAGDFASNRFARVELNPAERAGLLTRVGVMANLGSRNVPKLIKRGVFVNVHLLCRALPPPVPEAGSAPLEQGRTNRETWEKNTGAGTCGAVCHATIVNPPGYALEAYDALGRFRTEDNGYPVDTRATFVLEDRPYEIDGGVDLSLLLAESREAHRCWIGEWLRHLLGVSTWASAAEEGEAIAAALQELADGYATLSLVRREGFVRMIERLVTSDAFLGRSL